MNIILLGMPGAGKGTVATWMVEEKKYSHVSTGDLLRKEVAAGTELGKKVQAIMDAGELVSDDIMIEMIKNFLSQNSGSSGVIFDGFPRTLEQALSLGKITTIDSVIFLKVDEDIVIRRLQSREEGGAKRKDDTEEVIRERIRVYYENTQPLIDHYQEKQILHTVDGGQTIDEVRSSVAALL